MPLSPKKVVENAAETMKHGIMFTLGAVILTTLGVVMALWINPYRVSLIALMFGVTEGSAAQMVLSTVIFAFAIAGILVFFLVVLLAKARGYLMKILPDVPEKAVKSLQEESTEGKKEIQVSSSVSK